MARSFARCSKRSRTVSMWPYIIEAFVRMPRLCAVRMVSSHSAAVAFFGQMICRTRSERISAPPPGSESRPASLRISSTSRMDFPVILAKFTTSTGVNALQSASGSAALTCFTTST